jgi:hypothetical protein
MQRFGLYYLYKIYLSIFYFPHLPEVRSVWLNFSDSLPLSGLRVAAQQDQCSFSMLISTISIHINFFSRMPLKMARSSR